MLEEKHEEHDYFVPYTTYEKEQIRKYKNDKSRPANWEYHELDDYYVDHLGVHFNFRRYSRRKDRSPDQVRDFKVYEADEFTVCEKQMSSQSLDI